jgi:hypothetical protein
MKYFIEVGTGTEIKPNTKIPSKEYTFIMVLGFVLSKGSRVSGGSSKGRELTPTRHFPIQHKYFF